MQLGSMDSMDGELTLLRRLALSSARMREKRRRARQTYLLLAASFVVGAFVAFVV